VEPASLSIDQVALKKPDNPLDLLCRSLSDQLGPFGYEWLCACAVFPVVQLALTVHLGEALASAAGRRRPSEQELLAICRLPWFRKGWIPDDLRLRLVRDIGAPFRNSVREAIGQFVFSAIEASSCHYDQTPAPRLIDPPRNWPAVLDAWIAVGSEDTGPDAILLSFMRGRPVDPAFLRDVMPNRTIGSRIRELLDRRTLALFLIAITLSSGLWLFADKIASLRNTPVVSTPAATTLPMPSPAGSCASRVGSPSRSDAVKPLTQSIELLGIVHLESCVLREASGFVYGYIVRNLGSAVLSVQWEAPSLNFLVAPGEESFGTRINPSPPVTARSNVLFRATGLARSVTVETWIPDSSPAQAR
jgi:hypothetical protein